MDGTNITASHNPAGDNGFKICSHFGKKLDAGNQQIALCDEANWLK
jgi:phosphomannomutase